MVAVFAVLSLAALVVLLRALVRRRDRTVAGTGPGDLAAAVLAAVVRCLPLDRAAWGQAMIGELDHLGPRPERWRFVLGCARATLLQLPRRGGSHRLLLAVATAAAVAGAGLLGYGLVRYPGLRTGAGTWLAVAACLAVLCGYLLVTAIVAGQLGRSGKATRTGVAGGLVIAALWLLIGLAAAVPPSHDFGKVVLPAIPMTAVAVGAVGAWLDGHPRAGRQAAVLSALIGGLVLFVAWVGDTVVTGGRPYDSGLIRDFATSGSPDLATYAVNDNLGAAMGLLLLVPLLTTALGYAGAASASRRRRRPPG
jgi:hypothetical protein